jgi:HK97 family phage portal protein
MFKFLKRKKPSIKYATFLNSYEGQLGKDSTSFAAIDLICSAFANLSGDFYNFFDREKTEHRLKDLLEEPNSEDFKFSFFYNSAKDYFESGNVFWYKYDIDGEIVSLFRINPNDVRVQRDSLTNEKIFYYNGSVYTKEHILHIPSRFGYNGLVGDSVFDVCNEIFKNTSNLDLYVRNSFKNSVGKRLVIDASGAEPDITEAQIQILKEKFVSNYGGIENSGVPLIKKKGIDYNVVESGVGSNEAQQLTENRKFQENEIAKVLRVPIELLSSSSGGKDIESLYTLFLDNAVMPLSTAFEQAINKFLLTPLERKSIYFEYSYNNLMKTSLQTRIDTYTKQIMNGILSVNEVRRKENLPISKEEAGDTLFIQANLMPLKDKQIDSLLATAQLKLQELESNSNEFHSENPDGFGDDKA